MRFLADMGISLDVVHGLRPIHDAKHLREDALQRLPDEQILAKAIRENRIVLTHDLDMGELLALSGASSPSIVTFRLSDMTPPSVLRHLQEAIRRFGTALEKGAAVTINDRTIRCHELPIRRRSS